MTKEERKQRDIARLAEMKAHEDELRQQGYKHIAGIDEVGRGPLAGPVYAACVLLPPDFNELGIYDSKKLSAKKRDQLDAVIREKSLAYGIGIADNNEIDEINILEATKLAMKRAVDNCDQMLKKRQTKKTSDDPAANMTCDLDTDMICDSAADTPYHIAADTSSGPKLDYLLVDALKLELGIECEPIVKGDEKSLSIAAASILAKVARDKYMEELDEKYPGYDFASNKGYGTAKHYEGLRSFGITEIHRRSFLKKFEENPNTGHAQSKSDSTAAITTNEVKTVGKKVYAVKKGRTTGIFMTWDDCKAQVDGFAGAEYKSFADPKDAMAYLGLAGTGSAASGMKQETLPPGVRAYVDGSYDNGSGRFSCGVVILETDENGNTETTELKSAFDNAEAAKQRNVAGEIMGSKLAIDYCIQNEIKAIEIYHDYEGIGKWADGIWKANNPLTQGYRQYVADARQRMDIKFIKVKAHAGNKYNELADKLAKEALQ